MQDQSWLLNPLRRDDVPMLLKQFQMTKNEEKLFLLHDSGLGDQQWIFVFATLHVIYLLGEHEHWFVDGFC